ncbi:AAEL006220-PA [Aedes aegypti]|uniref:AAEL006220-PA n=1 Tax=Aedes aegypti TaxID=7159 RepID=Q176Y0_AEDAE|nr:AAEL006220-PA [Aedes aegypti]
MILANAADYLDTIMTVSNLSYRGLKDTNFTLDVIENLSPDTVYLNLQGNQLRLIPSSFPIYFPQLEKVILSENHLLSFPPNGSPFLRSPTLIELLCEFCGIHIVSTHSLSYLLRLEYLKLGHNRIRRISRYAFHQNRYLQYLDLSSNKLSTIPSGMLEGLFHMKSLDLSNNRNLASRNDAPFLVSDALEVLKCINCGFSEAYEDTFSALTNLKELHLVGNLFQTNTYLLAPTVLVIGQTFTFSSEGYYESYEQHNLIRKHHVVWWRNRTVVYF